jgi:hypothetical protein
MHSVHMQKGGYVCVFILILLGHYGIYTYIYNYIIHDYMYIFRRFSCFRAQERRI